MELVVLVGLPSIVMLGLWYAFRHADSVTRTHNIFEEVDKKELTEEK